MKKRDQMIIKILAVFIIALTLSLTIDTAFIFSSTSDETQTSDIQTVQAAEQKGCCIETRSGRTCVNDATSNDCLPNKFRTYAGPAQDCSIVAPDDCAPQTCIPKELNEPCLRSKTAAECIGMDGTPIPDEMESIPLCTKGCCIINDGEIADVMQNKTCLYKLNLTGYDESKMKFLPEVTGQKECKELGAPTDIVCCVLGGGTCKYGFRSECTLLEGRAVPLQGGQYCRDVRDCAVTEHSKKACGTRIGTEFDIYWFDSQGNQEELVQGCNYPESFCRVNQMTRQPECITTTCSFPSNMTHQNMTKSPPKVESIGLFTYTLLSGTSQCYNFYTHYGDDSMYGKSTGLQNEILHCALGKVEIQGLGADRNWLCNNAYGPNTPDVPSTLHGLEVNNTWQDCTKCGKGGLYDPAGDFFGPFPLFGGLLNILIGKVCSKGECKNLGDCTYMEKIGAFIGGSQISVCIPVYPPGTNAVSNGNTQCGMCGQGGGNGIWSFCKESECEALGDCEFKKYKDWEYLLYGTLVTLGAILLGRIIWIPVDCLIYGCVYHNMASPPCAQFPVEFANCWRLRTKEHIVVKIISWPFNILKGVSNPIGEIGKAVELITGLGGILAIFGAFNKK